MREINMKKGDMDFLCSEVKFVLNQRQEDLDMKIKVKMNLVQKVKSSYPEFELDTHAYPELEGKTLDEIRAYVEKHANAMHSLKGSNISLLDELNLVAERYVLDVYPEESHFYVTAEDERG